MNRRSPQPLPLMDMTAKTRVLLIALRLVLTAMTVMAIATFVHGLPGPR